MRISLNSQTLLCGANQTIKNLHGSPLAPLVGYWAQSVESDRKSRYWWARVSYLIFCLWFGTFTAGGGELFAAAPGDCTFDKGAFLFHSDLHLLIPVRKLMVFNFIDARLKFRDSANKIDSPLPIVSTQGQSVSQNKADQNTDETNQCVCNIAIHIWVFLVGLTIGFVCSLVTARK